MSKINTSPTTMKNITTKSTSYYLIAIFFLALLVRFVYFPNDLSFTYDQARDAFTSLKLFSGDLKIIGPPTPLEGIFHGPLFYYVAGPLYLLSNGNPEFVSAIFRIYNALGIFLIFIVAKTLFNKKVGLLSAIIYAFSFEQTQYALFLGHPSLAVITVLLFYLGLALLFFKQERSGLAISLIGLGLSIQSHFAFIILFVPLILLLISSKKQIPKLDIRTIYLSILAFFISISTFVAAELKFNFRIINALIDIFFKKGGGTTKLNWGNVIFVSQRFITDNLYYGEKVSKILLILFIFVLFILIKNKKYHKKSIFLSVWLVGGLLVSLFNSSYPPAYHYAIGGSISLIILASFLLSKIFSISKVATIILLGVVIFSNVTHSSKLNPEGTIVEIISQDGMLLDDQKKAIDFIYHDANKDLFSVSALTIPYRVNTTWAYLFEWHGMQKFGYLPIWGGSTAEGFGGNLEVETARSNLPEKHYVVLEPTRGLHSWLITNFLKEEDLFTKNVEEKRFGKIVVQKRIPI
jgi:4-amino-4-deoxy-L-arabinose transferase-like glycosyltransferase